MAGNVQLSNMSSQNPPTIPTFPVVCLVCLLRGSRMVIDWHNYGYTILALKLGSDNPLVSLSQRSVCESSVICLLMHRSDQISNNLMLR